MKLGSKMKSMEVRRTFSESFKKEQVKLIETGKVSVRQICKAYKVSDTSVYKWIKLYSKELPSTVRQVVELESEALRTIELEKKTEELERIIGQKQLQIDYLEKLIELAGDAYGEDLKKVMAGKLSNGSKK